MKLHPDAVAKTESDARTEFVDALELCSYVIGAEGWDSLLVARRVSGTALVQVVHSPRGSDRRDPSIVLTVSDSDFADGKVTRVLVRSECQRFLRNYSQD